MYPNSGFGIKMGDKAIEETHCSLSVFAVTFESILISEIKDIIILLLKQLRCVTCNK